MGIKFTASSHRPRSIGKEQLPPITITIEDTIQMQFMLDTGRSVTVAYQHLLHKFLHTWTNVVPIQDDDYLRNAHNSLGAFFLKNLSFGCHFMSLNVYLKVKVWNLH